jgi:hypothetical protein
VMVHMAGLRQESWGRRVMMRAFGVWQDGADAVAPEAWVSARAPEAEKAPIDDAAGRRRAWTATGKLLTAVDVVNPTTPLFCDALRVALGEIPHRQAPSLHFLEPCGPTTHARSWAARVGESWYSKPPRLRP